MLRIRSTNSSKLFESRTIKTNKVIQGKNGSTATQMEGRTMNKCITFSSSRVKPLPALDFMLYLRVWHWTMGRRGPAVGRGNIFAAFF